jgi:hypothetical protein
MGRGVLVRTGVAAAGPTADKALAKVQPGSANLET